MSTSGQSVLDLDGTNKLIQILLLKQVTKYKTFVRTLKSSTGGSGGCWCYSSTAVVGLSMSKAGVGFGILSGGSIS